MKTCLHSLQYYVGILLSTVLSIGLAAQLVIGQTGLSEIKVTIIPHRSRYQLILNDFSSLVENFDRRCELI